MTTRKTPVRSTPQPKVAISRRQQVSEASGTERSNRSGKRENSRSTSKSRSGTRMAETTRKAVAGGDGKESADPQRKAGAESLDKVRDILFGAQSRDYEKRFTRLEERLIKESADLRDELRRRFDSLETYVKKEIESLGGRLKAEQDSRGESLKDLARELKETAKAFEKKTGQIDDHLTKSQRELRDQILHQSKSMSDDLQKTHEQLSAALEKEAGELRHEKTDRAALATLFMEVAMRLNNEFNLPGPEDLSDD
jgi:hypothetical protein